MGEKFKTAILVVITLFIIGFGFYKFSLNDYYYTTVILKWGLYISIALVCISILYYCFVFIFGIVSFIYIVICDIFYKLGSIVAKITGKNFDSKRNQLTDAEKAKLKSYSSIPLHTPIKLYDDED